MGKFTRVVIPSLIFIFSVGCVTPYQPSGFMGGYKDSKLNPGEYEISFYFNAFSFIVNDAPKKWHRRATEICGGPNSYTIIEGPDREIIPKARIFGKIQRKEQTKQPGI
jgi:hypothetical protein